MRKSTDAEIRAYRKWNKKTNKLYAIKIRLDSGLPEIIDNSIAESGKSMNAWIIQAIRERLEHEGKL